MYGHAIYADYLIAGDVPDAEFQRIDIRYSDISEWFLQWRTIDGVVGEKLTWSGLPQKISADFDDANRRFHLTTEYVGYVGHNGKDHVLHEYIEFAIRPASGRLTAQDAKEKAMEFACLLSILIAQPVSILAVTVQTQAGRNFALYFPTFRPVVRDTSINDFLRDCFTQKHWLDAYWESVIQKYFQSAHRKIRWMRLAGMQRYEGFWEYKTLGYVSLLDSYVSHNLLKKIVVPPRAKSMSKLQDALNGVSPRLDSRMLTDVLDAVRQAFSHLQEATFPEKYATAIASTDADIVKIINITGENFRLIKKVRDKIAHGDAIELKEAEFQQIHIVVTRIELLLTYWAYVDFGLSKGDFLKGLKSPFNRLRRLAQVDEKHLARVTDAAAFFALDADGFGHLSSYSGSGVFACFTEGPNREITFSEHYTQMHKDWHMGHHKGVFTADQIFGVSPDVVRHVSHMYVECEGKALEFHSAYIFDESKLAAACPASVPVVKVEAPERGGANEF